MTTFFDIRDEYNKKGKVLIATDIENGEKFILNEKYSISTNNRL
ncbi:MAG: hypothetical protein ACLUE7_05940 [Lachnospirales bacterium]